MNPKVLSNEQAIALMSEPESHYLDRKSLRLAPRDLQKHAVAFANANGGAIILGIEDERSSEQVNHRWSGGKSPEDFNQFFQALQEISPKINYSTEYFISEAKNGIVLKISIQASRSVHQTSDKKFYRRINAQSLPLSPHEAIDLANKRTRSRVIGIILGLLFLTAIAMITAFLATKNKGQFSRSEGLISGKILGDQPDFYFNFGSNIVHFNGKALIKGISVKDLIPINLSIISPEAKVYIDGQNFYLDAVIKGENGEVLCQIVRNNWETSLSKEYDRNYSVNAFELVDAQLFPIFQIVLVDDNKFFVGGKFLTTSGKYWYSTPKSFSDIKPEAIRIFRYPSSEHFGEYDPSSPKPNFSVPSN